MKNGDVVKIKECYKDIYPEVDHKAKLIFRGFTSRKNIVYVEVCDPKINNTTICVYSYQIELV